MNSRPIFYKIVDLLDCPHEHRLLRALAQILLFVTALSASCIASAHALEQSYVFLNLNNDQVTGRIEIAVADVNTALSLNLPVNQTLDTPTFAPHTEQLKNYLSDRVSVSAPGQNNTLHLGNVEFLTLDFIQFIVLDFKMESAVGIPQALDVSYSVLFDQEPEHTAFIVVENNWKTGTFDNEAQFALVFNKGDSKQTIDLSSSSTLSGVWGMVKLGVHHIWEGIDHLLFLLALLLPAAMVRRGRVWSPVPSFRPALIYVLKIVTLFTVAHTITLSIATLTVIPISSRIVESIIAISIAVAALDLLYPIFRNRIGWVVFAFGLFHGFGFASVLSTIGIPPGYMGYSLLAFNVGVELGQLVVVALLFPLIYLSRNWRFYVPVILKIGSVMLIIVSLYWFIERGFMIDIPLDENYQWYLKKLTTLV